MGRTDGGVACVHPLLTPQESESPSPGGADGCAQANGGGVGRNLALRLEHFLHF